jgi:hypothetical protein
LSGRYGFRSSLLHLQLSLQRAGKKTQTKSYIIYRQYVYNNQAHIGLSHYLDNHALKL